MFRSSTFHARRFLVLAFAALGVLTAGCSSTTVARGGAAEPTDLDNPVRTRASLRVVSELPVATTSAFSQSSHRPPARSAHVAATPR